MKVLLAFYFILLLPALVPGQPVNFEWAKRIGSDRTDYVIETAIDKAGNVYNTGTFQGTVDVNPGAGGFTVTASGERDIYINKYDAAGNFLWSKQIGNNATINNEGVASLALDQSRNIYITTPCCLMILVRLAATHFKTS